MKIQSLQILRAYAALLVLLRHLTKHFNNDGKALFGDFFLNGFSGVDIFFVLSGFIIIYSSDKYLQNTKSDLRNVKSYFIKRIIRVYPTYWFFLFFPILLIYFFSPNLIEYSPSSILSLIKTFLLFFGHDKVSVVTWTLSYEVFFYLIFGLFLISKRFLILIVPIIVMSIYTLIFCYDTSFYYDQALPLKIYDNKIFNYVFNPIVLEFLFGVLIYYLFKKGYRFNSILLISIYLISYIFTSQVQFTDWYSFFVFFRVLFYGLPAAILIYFLLQLNIQSNSRWFKMLILLGDASYVFYLIHNPMLSLSYRYLLSQIQHIYLMYFFIFLLIVFISLISVFFHLKVENKIISYLRSQLLNKL